MNSERAQALADRKALLVARAELDRARVALAFEDTRAIAFPRPEPDRLDVYRSKAKWVLGIALPLLGRPRLGRWLRVASFGLLAFRLVRSWRGSAR